MEYMGKPSARIPAGSPLPASAPSLPVSAASPAGIGGRAPAGPARRGPVAAAPGRGHVPRGIVPRAEFAYAGAVTRLTSVLGWLAVAAVAVAPSCGAPKLSVVA